MHKLILLIILLPLFTFGQAKKFVRQGIRATDPKEQISLFSQAIEIDSKNLDAYFYRGLAKFNIGEYNTAILDFTKVIFYKPDADSYYNRANSKFNLEDYQGALEDYTKATELDPELIDAYYNLGNTKYYLGDYAGAIKDLSIVLSFFPRDVKTYNQRAQAHMALKNYKKAFKDFRYSILISPNDNAFYNRGIALLDVRYFKEAQVDFFKVIKLNKNNVPAYFYLAASHLFLGEFTAAISTFNVSIKQDALDFDAYLGLSMSYLKSNDLEQAKSHFQKAKNILLVKDSNDIKSFENSYWYQNHYYYFNAAFEKLIKL
ncbi:MAG: tetratricopeptide repeat protein [Algibacter sp.]